MAVIYIELKRIGHNKNIYSYHVSTSSLGGADFVIKIDVEAEQLYFFENENSEEPVVRYDFKTRTLYKLISSDINQQVFPYVIIKAYKAIRENEFPEYICYAA